MPYTNKRFTDVDVHLDGETFEQCHFKNCRMIYSGGEPVTFSMGCTVEECSFAFEGAASRTLLLLQMLTSGSKAGALALETALDQIATSTRDTDNEDQPVFYFMGAHVQHGSAIAQILAIASALEFFLCGLFAWMIQCAPPHAAAAFFALQNNKARMDMVRDLIQHLHSDEERTEVKRLLELSQQCFEKRNEYAHALWQAKGEKLYVTEGKGTHYPHGIKRLVKLDTILKDLATVRKNTKTVNEGIKVLTGKRPLVIAQGAIKPSYAPKFLSQSSRHAPKDDPKLRSKIEEREPPHESSPPKAEGES